MRRLPLAATIALMAVGCTRPRPAAQTAAQFPTCSPLVWLVENLVVLAMPSSGGWAVNGQPMDSARLALEIPAIYAQRPAPYRLLIVQATDRRQNEDLRWLLAPLDSLAVTVVARPLRPAVVDSAGMQQTEGMPERSSPRVAGALDSLKAGSITAEAAAQTIADELIATCNVIAEDTVPIVKSYVRAELERRAGWH